MNNSNHESRTSLNECIEAYERSVATGDHCALESFLPEESHPAYADIVVELVRVEIELRRGLPASSVADYCQRFPRVFSDRTRLSSIAFEEYRIRRQHGDDVTPADYATQFQIETANWPTVDSRVVAASGTSGETAPVEERIPSSMTDMEGDELRRRVAEAFPEFEPVEELGRGAFGRVFLARQRQLADRFVVIKVTSDTTSEPERLAKLQHTNIMPVYSVHRARHWQAICMPFFGRRTLKDVPPQEIAATLQLVLQIAEGLEHAHSNGILHRDVKPANILVTDEGQPLLLDFNLSSDVAAQAMNRSVVGGTIPYLAPEQLESLQSGKAVGATADLHSLGIILFERIAGRLPFRTPSSTTLSSLVRNAQERRSMAIPRLRALVPEVSHAIQDIVLKCLHPDPDHRYQTAGQLAEDLQCELSHRPLKYAQNSSVYERVTKWRRRHPRILSLTTLATALLVLVITSAAGGYWLQRRIEGLRAQTQWNEFREELPSARTLLSSVDASASVLEQGIAAGERLLNGYRVQDTSEWHLRPEVARLSKLERARLDEQVAEIVYLTASAGLRRARFCTDEESRNRWLVSALRWNGLQERLESAASEKEMWLVQRYSIDVAMGVSPTNDMPAIEMLTKTKGKLSDFVTAVQHLETGHVSAAAALLESIVQQNAHDYSAWYLLGKSRQLLKDYAGADAAYSTCIAMNEDCWITWLDRAAARISAGRFQEAIRDCDNVISRMPGSAEAYLNRGIANGSAGNFNAAVEDVTTAIDKGSPKRAVFLRASYRQQLGDVSGAVADYQAGLTSQPDDCDSWLCRGMAYLESSPEQALADFTEAARLNPSSRDALQNSAHVLSERLNRTAEAIDCLNRLLQLDANDNQARIGRAVLLARLARDAEALQDVEQVMSNAPEAVTIYQAACVYSLLSVRDEAHIQKAIALLSNALTRQPDVSAMAENDPDLNPIRDRKEFSTMLNACRQLLSPHSIEVGGIGQSADFATSK